MVFKVIAISGSLEKDASNSGLIRACLQSHNPQLQIEVIDISTFPLFNMDPVLEGGYPPQVQDARQKVQNADAILMSTPQHNYKISAALKNAYDWLSFTDNLQVPPPVKFIPAGIIGSSRTGAERAVQHLVRVLQYCKVRVMPKKLTIKKTPQKFDKEGNVKCEQLKKQLEVFLKQFAKFIEQNKRK